MDWVTGLPPGGDKSFNYCIVIFHRFSKTPIFFPCHKVDTAMDTDLLLWHRVVLCTGTFTNIISDRDPEFTSPLWKKLHQLFGEKLSFSTAYHPQADGLSERMSENFEDMVIRACAYVQELKDDDGFTHYWCTLLPELELVYKTSINSNTNQTPAIIGKGWNPRLPQSSLRKELVKIDPTTSILKLILQKARNHLLRCMADSFEYSKDNWDELNATPDFKVGDLVLVSTTNFKKSKDEKISKTPLKELMLSKPFTGRILLN
ncbi:hypothetical protein O181_087970 [Austropuccinia psidii MF-1]|uniref:Integrase catalytic domain-containing protein n=1 Tax=Austropuccinia psidii MF-1 TaxID=1389203 RepID=A0A9Q3P2Z1_9BASI|nr:hypothetical protein [Austropuccinia psidii MF-1]